MPAARLHRVDPHPPTSATGPEVAHPGPTGTDNPPPGQAPREPPLYLQLAARLTQAMASGALPPGARLPSVRQAAREQLVSVATVLQAYRHLEDARLLQSRPKSGFFVASAAELARAQLSAGGWAAPGQPGAAHGGRPTRARGQQPPEPGTSSPPGAALAVDISSLSERVMLAASDPRVVSFGAACPSPELFDGERVRRALSQATLRQRALLTRYPLVPGLEALRSAIARRALAMGCTLDPQDVVITNGTNEAVALCLQAVTRPGDTVALESPTSFGFLQILEALHLKALEIPTHPRHGLSVDALALALQTQPVRAVLAVPTLQNPLGACMPLAERKRLAQLLAAHQVPLVEDVIYNDLAEREEHRRAVKSFDEAGLVMLCGSFSKTVAPGLRVGWLEAGRHATAVRRLKAAFSGGHTGVAEHAMAELLGHTGYEAQLRRLRRAFAPRIAEARRLIADHFPRGTRVTDPAGGMMLWLELPAGNDALALFQTALAEGICVAPGSMFSASDRYRHCLRLSVGSAWGDAQRQALRQLGALAGVGLPPAVPAEPVALTDRPLAAA